jgi:hypothetical protein
MRLNHRQIQPQLIGAYSGRTHPIGEQHKLFFDAAPAGTAASGIARLAYSPVCGLRRLGCESPNWRIRESGSLK